MFNHKPFVTLLYPNLKKVFNIRHRKIKQRRYIESKKLFDKNEKIVPKAYA